jgi:hypothetical protein
MPDVQSGKFVQMTLLIPITGDVFKDTPAIQPALKAVEDFEKALKAAKLPHGWTLETEQITRRGPKTASTSAAAAPGQPEPTPDEPPLLPVEGEQAASAPWRPAAQ